METRKFQTLGEFMGALCNEPRITFRIHGMHGELRKAMFHRFPVKGGISQREYIAQNISRSNSLLEALTSRPQQPHG